MIFFKKNYEFGDYLHLASAYVKDKGTFRQLEQLSYNGTTNTPAQALIIVNGFTTKLKEAIIEWLKKYLCFTLNKLEQGIFYPKKKNTIVFTLKQVHLKTDVCCISTQDKEALVFCGFM